MSKEVDELLAEVKEKFPPPAKHDWMANGTADNTLLQSCKCGAIRDFDLANPLDGWGQMCAGDEKCRRGLKRYLVKYKREGDD